MNPEKFIAAERPADQSEVNNLNEQEAASIINSETGVTPHDSPEAATAKISDAVENKGLLQKIAETPALRNAMKVLLLTIGLTIGERSFSQNQIQENPAGPQTEERLEKFDLEKKLSDLASQLDSLGLLQDAKNVDIRDELKIFGTELSRTEKENLKYANYGNFKFEYRTDERRMQIDIKENGIRTLIRSGLEAISFSDQPQAGFTTVTGNEFNKNIDLVHRFMFLSSADEENIHYKILSEEEINQQLESIKLDINKNQTNP